MKSSRPAAIPTHRARRAERTDAMEEDKKAIISMLDAVKEKLVMKMIREIVHWLCIHQEDLI